MFRINVGRYNEKHDRFTIVLLALSTVKMDPGYIIFVYLDAL